MYSLTNNLLFDLSEEIATVTFNRPDARNVIDYEGWLELGSLAHTLAKDPNVKAVILTGKGNEAFSAGADIKDFDLNRTDSAQAKTYAKAFDGALNAIERIPKPTISLIRGYCVGGGCELSLATDIRIAANNSRFGIPAARLGILVGYQEMRRLVALIGPGNTSYLLLSGRLIDAPEALRMGLINNLTSLDKIDEYAYRLAKEIVALAPMSHQGHKEILRLVQRPSSLASLPPQKKHLPYANFDTADFKEGLMAFKERRRPNFQGL